MRDSRAKLPILWLAAGAATLTTVLLPAASVSAQESSGPLGFLKPWIERQFFGKDASATPVEPAPGALPQERENVPAAEAQPNEAVAPPDAAPAGTAPESAIAATPPPIDDAGAALRGASPPDDNAAAADTPPPESPPAGVAADQPPPPTESPAGVAQQRSQPLRFALLVGRGVTATMAAAGPIADELAKLLNRPVELLPLTSYGAMIDAQEQRRIDGGFYSAAAFAVADSRCNCLEPMVAPRASDGTLAYHAVIVAKANAGIASIADLHGKTVAIGATDSIGARRMQLAALLSEGVDPAATFASVLEVGSAEAAVRLVAAGRADAAFAWSSLAGRVESGYSRGTLADLVADGEIAMDSMAIVWRSPAIAHGPFAVMRTLPETEKSKIEAYLVALATTNPAAYDMLNPFYGGGYAPVDPQDYAGVEILAAQNVDALRMPKPEATVGPTANAPIEIPSPTP